MNVDLQLDPLLHALRAAGLRVGVSEILRLQQVFANEPSIGDVKVSRERLKSLLRAVLVKSVDNRETFDRICDVWLDRAGEELKLRQMRLPPAPVPPPVYHRVRWKSAAMAGTLAFLLLALLLWVARSWQPAPASLPTEPVGPAPGTVAPPKITGWRLLPWPEIGFATLAWLGASGLLVALRRRRLLPDLGLAAPAAEAPRAFPLPMTPTGAVLLAPHDQEVLTWGISRFVADEPTSRLDLTATVRAMALAGGLPEMRFHRARFYREVWLWVDEDTDDPALPRLAEEIVAVLEAHGLPVERATFRGVPHRLVTATGQVLAPKEIDERREFALVAVLTDGRRLVRRRATDYQRVRIDALLRSLSHWPHLAFVDASREGEGLAAILGRHGIAAVAPERAAIFLGGAAVPRESWKKESRPKWGGEAAWAATCALCPSPVDEATALELHRRLGLAASPYSLQALRAEAPGPPGRLAWRTTDRIRRVRWLCEAETHPEGAVMPESLLGRALDFWEEVYDRSLGGDLAHTREGLHNDTPAQRFLRMERALLGLWRKPTDYIGELYSLYQGPLREAIGQHCETLAPADWGNTGLIHLPWTWSARTRGERAMLQEMRFGGMPPVSPRRPGRIWLGIGLLIGLGLAAAVVGALRP